MRCLRLPRAISANEKLQDFLAGKDEAIKFLVGQVMKTTRGRARPNVVEDVLREKLKDRA
jgi:aspartyl-tRNA(Asn)/glutamyl-tRNA(Gln) amidotransferase subunit B